MKTIVTSANRSHYLLILVIALLLETALLVGLYYKYRSSASEVPYAPHERPLVERAIKIYANQHRLPTKTVMQGRFAIVARTADGKCVNIRPKTGAIGSVPIVCFDHEGKQTYYEER